MKFIKPSFFGILAALGALLIEVTFSLFLGSPQEIKNIFLIEITPFLLLAVLIEESSKLLFIHRISKEGELKENVLFASFFLGLGFSLTELFLISFNFPPERDIFKFILVFAGMILLHTLTATIGGYFMAKAKKINVVFIIRTLFILFSIHLIYNSLLIYDFL